MTYRGGMLLHRKGRIQWECKHKQTGWREVRNLCFSVLLEVFELEFWPMFALVRNFISSVQGFRCITSKYLILFADTQVTLALPHLYGRDCRWISHLMFGSFSSVLSFQMYCDSLVDVWRKMLLKLYLWFEYRSLNSVSVLPIYSLVSDWSSVVTVALYMMALERHFPSSGHICLRQLHGGGALGSGSRSLLLWAAIICFILGVQL